MGMTRAVAVAVAIVVPFASASDASRFGPSSRIEVGAE
jgi:hypothetical protein